jgi:membrane-bound metal-dependent hydrolase YbcI (DUF457 family)
VIQAALHLVAATLLALVFGRPTPLILALALLLALAPDLDTPRSLVGSLLKSISVPLERRLGHRTATHSMAALLLVAGLAYLLIPDGWQALAAGYPSHLLLDLLIGVQGVMRFLPGQGFLTLTAWRDDGPAPRTLLPAMLPLLLIAALWPQLRPLTAPITARMALANPIATPSPTKTQPPSIRLRFTLPDSISLSALQVRAGT